MFNYAPGSNGEHKTETFRSQSTEDGEECKSRSFSWYEPVNVQRSNKENDVFWQNILNSRQNFSLPTKEKVNQLELELKGAFDRKVKDSDKEGIFWQQTNNVFSRLKSPNISEYAEL